MKRYIFALLSLVAFVACNSFDEPTYSEPANNDNNIVEKVVAYANINGAGDTRVALTPGTNAEGKPIIKADWEPSGEKFTVYNYDELHNAPSSAQRYDFTQVSGNEFTGSLPYSENGYLALYNCTLNSWTLDFDLSKQDGTLNGDYVMMLGEALPVSSSDEEVTFDFEHCTTILKPTFKFNGEDIDAQIASIEVGNILAAKSDDYSSIQTITVTPSELEDIYIFIPEPTYGWRLDNKYKKDHVFTFTVTTNDGFVFESELKLPIDLETGKFYTATINLNATFSYLPDGYTFRLALNEYLEGMYKVAFVANSSYADGEPMEGTYGCPVYFKKNDNQTVEIYTAGDKFIFNKDCSFMFSGQDNSPLFRNITSIDFTNCDTSRVKNMKSMFDFCQMLHMLENLNVFDTSNVENMYRMFAQCGKNNGFTPESGKFDLSSFDTSNVTNMYGMFFDFNGGKLDISHFKMPKVTSVQDMFRGATRLQELKLGGFNVPEGCDMSNMFFNTGLGLGTGNTTKIIVKDQSVIDRFTTAGNTGFNSQYAEFVIE